MTKRKDEPYDDLSVPLPIQTFLWGQTSPFIRPKFGKLHEASCMEQREACKLFEKVLVQNIQFDLSPGLCDAIKSISRWRLVRAAFPHVMHCCAALLYRRKDHFLDKLGASETKLLYTLQWILLDAVEECADSDHEKGVYHPPSHYLFPISALQVFIYLFAPLNDFLKHTDFMSSFRLENGLKIWEAFWEFRHPTIACFTTPVLPKQNFVVNKQVKQIPDKFGDVFLGNVKRVSKDDRAASFGSSDTSPALTVTSPASSGSGTSPRNFEAESTKSSVRGEAKNGSLICDTCSLPALKTEEAGHVVFKCKCGNLVVSDQDDAKPNGTKPLSEPKPQSGKPGALVNICMATHMDVAVLRCLFISQWLEEGIYWALKFLFTRLKDIKMVLSQQPSLRKRSSSLPIPEIEISLYQSPEQQKKDSSSSAMENIFLVDATYEPPSHHTSMHELRHSSLDSQTEKQKSKWMKMGDLKLFVEGKFRLSERLLDKIGKEISHGSSLSEERSVTETSEPINTSQKFEAGLSSDASEIQRPRSALAMLDHMPSKSDDTDPSALTKIEMVRGRSMPSLHLNGEQLKAELIAPPLINQDVDILAMKKLPAYHTFSVPNPIITVTEHSPVASVQFFLNQDSADSQHDENSPPTTPLLRQFITRSQTDSNITYADNDACEAEGSTYYITPNGEINIHVVLKAVHAITLGVSTCSLRVCEVALNLLDLLISLDILPSDQEKESDRQTAEKSDDTLGMPATDTSYHTQSGRSKTITDKKREELSTHQLFMDSIVRIYKHLGCPHGCEDGHRSPTAELLRSQMLCALKHLYESDKKQFRSFLQDMVKNRALTEVIDFFHAFVGFCSLPGPLLSPLAQKRASTGGSQDGTKNSYANNFGAGFANNGLKGPEGLLLGNSFKTLVSRLVLARKDLKSQENMPLYRNIRLLLSYVRENHGGLFRRVLFSGLLDSAERPYNKSKNTIQTTRIVRHTKSVDHEDYRDLIYSPTVYVIDETSSTKSSRKSFFRKKGVRKAPSTQSMTDDRDDIISCPSPSPGQVAPPFLRYDKIIGPRLSVSDDENLGYQPTPKHKSNRFPIVNWLKGDKMRHSEYSFPEDDGSSPPSLIEGFSLPEKLSRGASLINRTPKLGIKTTSQVSVTLSKARKRMEDHLNKFGFGRNKSKHGSFEEPLDISRRNSCDFDHGLKEGEFLVAKESKIVNILAVKDGMQRFSFLLEASRPGVIPDAIFLAAALELKAPVVSRAALYLECAYFVHRCNKGCWPSWMKMSLPVFRPSGPLTSGTSTGLKQAHTLQITAGRMFYQWAETIGRRLDEILEQEQNNQTTTTVGDLDDSKKRQLRLEDEEEDFLDEACVNPNGSDCPPALRIAACQLLLEITTFLRETFQYIPTKSSRMSGREKHIFEPRNMTANRRWSMALSSLGFSQNSAHSIVSLAEHPGVPPQNERRISFFLQDDEGESENSSNTTIAVQDDEERKGKKIGRPHLLRRGPSASTSHSSSFKRRSIKLKKPGDKRSRARSSTFAEDEEDATLKRSDSIQSRRKVSAVSDRSDTSERADVSGEESPGVLSDEQPPESPVDLMENDDTTLTRNLPWLKTIVQVTSSLNFTCQHQYFCQTQCYRRQMRSCNRLVKAVRKVYGEDFATLLDAEKQRDEKNDIKKEKKIKKIITAPSSPLRRKTSIAHNLDKLERPMEVPHLGAFRSLHSSTTFLAHDIEAGVHAEKAEVKVPPPKPKDKTKPKDDLPVLKYIKSQVKNLFHCMLSTIIKGAVVMPEDHFADVLSLAWELLLESDQQLASAAAVAFILSSVKAPEQAAELLKRELKHEDTSCRVKAILKFHVLWRNRYQCWPRMEEGAHITFKVPPPTIEFTLPSPKIAQDRVPVADTPWMPHVKAKVEEVTISQDQTLQRSFVTATKTRRKQQMELIHKALQDEVEKKRTERENYPLTTVAVTSQAAYEPALFQTQEHEEGDEDLPLERTTTHHMQAAQALFPSCLCSAAIPIIGLLEDAQVNPDGIAVYEAAFKVIWLCLVEDTALFLRHILEKLTREKQAEMFQILRKLLRFLPQLPPQSAYTLYNYLIGYVMFYVRTPFDSGQDNIGNALSVLWQVVPSVHGLFLKDLKQTLRKEQCDAALLITANVPSAKKIIIHGPDASGIPSQYPIHEDTQFNVILQDSLDFFAIEESQQSSHFLVDTKTNQMHNPDWFVRDFYFFKRSQYPQLSLIHMQKEEAYEVLQKQALKLKFLELGKVLMSLAILKSNTQIAQRVFFLHEELMKLPSFPRKALEADFNLYSEPLGKEMLGMDTLHKMVWVKLIARMFDAMAGMFVHSSDIHLFLNVVNGALVLHSEDAAMLRFCMATFLNAAHQFKNIFASNGYLLIMPTMLRIYSNHQTNNLLCRTIEFVCKQFYIMHRKPFILQMFGSAAPILDMDTLSVYGDANKVQPKAFFQLLQSLEQYVVDPLDILELVDIEKPLRALDFCYQMDPDTLSILDAISLCITVVSYAADSHRGHQMLTILEAILPFYLKHLQNLTMKKETPGGSRTELSMIHNISICMKTLVSNCEALARNYTGPQRAIDLRGSSIKNISRGACSPPYEIDDDSQSKFMSDSYYTSRKQQQQTYDRHIEDSEILRTEFRRPRDTLLHVVSEFLTTCSARLADLSKKVPDLTSKTTELLDVKCHLRLAEVAHSLLKVSPYDPMTMACRGLQRYMNEVLPHSEWAQEAMRPALIMVLRRIDKTFNKIAKKPAIRRLVDWNAARSLLKGVYLTLFRHPYIAHLPHLKSLVSVCQSLILGDHSSNAESVTNLPSSTGAMGLSPPPSFCSVVVRLIAMQIVALGETQSLESVCGGTAATSSPEKVEVYLMNLVLPLCIRICSGVKEVPKLRHSDITFALNVVLHALAPVPVRQSQGTAKSSSDSCGHDKSPNRAKLFLFHIGFLGLKVLIVCFEKQMSPDWHRIASCIRELGDRMQGGLGLWNFINFVVTHRTPLYVLLYPMIRCKILQTVCDSEQEYVIQQQIKSKVEGTTLPTPKNRGRLFADAISELMSLKEDLISWRIGGGNIRRLKSTVSAERSNSDSSQPAQPAVQQQQPGGISRRHSSFTEHTTEHQVFSRTESLPEGSEADQPLSPTDHDSRHFFKAGQSLKRHKGLSIKLNAKIGSRRVLKQLLRRSSYPYPQDDGSSSQDAFSGQGPAGSEPRLWRKSTLLIKKGGSKKSAAGSGSSLTSVGNNGGPSHDQEQFRDNEDDLTSPSSQPPSCPSSPVSGVQSPDPDSEAQLPRHRLQRQRGPSRKTFRYRKSHRGAGWATRTDVEDTSGETIAMVPTKKQPTLTEEDGAGSAACPEVSYLPKQKSMMSEVVQSPVERRARRHHGKKRFRSQSQSPTSPDDPTSPVPLSPSDIGVAPCESTESLSTSEKSALLREEESHMKRSQSSLLMIFPNKDGDNTCV